MKKLLLAATILLFSASFAVAGDEVRVIDWGNSREVTAYHSFGKDYLTVRTSGGTFHIFPCGEIQEEKVEMKTIRSNSFDVESVNLTGYSLLFDRVISTLGTDGEIVFFSGTEEE